MANIEIPDEFVTCIKCGEFYDIDEIPSRICPKCGGELLPDSEYFAREVGFVEQPTPQNTPKCPTCGSTNVEKISTAKKAFGFAMVGLFSSNLGKTMHCRNCGYKW